jgi:hypothetical protein
MALSSGTVHAVEVWMRVEECKLANKRDEQDNFIKLCVRKDRLNENK